MLKHAPAGTDFFVNLDATDITRLADAARVACCIATGWMVMRLSAAGEPPSWLPGAIVALALFVLYSIGLYVWAVHNRDADEALFAQWGDSLWYLAFTGMTGGPESPLWLLLAFPIFFIALRDGSAAGIAMAVFSAIALFFVGALTIDTHEQVLRVDVFVPPFALALSGYVIVMWADSGSMLGRQHAALKEIDRLFNPRLNIDQLIDKVVEQLATIYRIRGYALVLSEPGSAARLYRAVLPQGFVRASERTAAEVSRPLFAIDVKDGVVFGHISSESLDADVPDSADALLSRGSGAAIVANALGCNAFCAIEFDLRQGGGARLFLCSDEPCFGPADLQYFAQLRRQLSPRLENLQLLDRLAREVVEEERRRLSRDVHDSAIQPYIGLKFALEALARRVSPADPLSGDIGRLVEMTTLEIAELRRFVKGLRGQGKPDNASVVPVVRRQAARFGELYGIRVSVEATGDFGINESLACEVFHIVSEGLSNIRRHTTAAIAQISLSCNMENLAVQIVNPCNADAPTKTFAPRSISERASSLGGACRVEIRPDHGTVVAVEIPLRQ